MAYGIGASLGNGGLVGVGLSQKQQALDALGKAADEEQERELAWKRREAGRKQANQQLGATAGAMIGMQYGSSLGPWGAVIGGAAGALAGRFM